MLPQLNTLNPDKDHPVYSTENGIYQPNCGLKALRFAVGHDEYMYRFLLHNKCPLAEFPEALAVLRYVHALIARKLSHQEAIPPIPPPCHRNTCPKSRCDFWLVCLPPPVWVLACFVARRYHSCYPLHLMRAYDRFLAPGDEALLQAVVDFNQFDLYSKSDYIPDLDTVRA